MANVTRPTSRLQQRRGLAATWANANPVLADGELGIEINPSGPELIKCGDGETAWNDLPYVGGSGDVAAEIAALVGDTNTDLLDIYTTARDGV